MERQGVSCPADHVTCSHIHDEWEMLIVEYAAPYLFYDVFITVLCVKYLTCLDLTYLSWPSLAKPNLT